MLAGHVVGVDQRRLEVAVPHPLLQGAHRHARPRPSASRTCAGGRGSAPSRTPPARSVALKRLSTFERSSGTPSSGWPNTRSRRSGSATPDSGAQARRPSAWRAAPHASRGGTSGVPISPRTPGAPDADLARRPVDVTPAQPEQLALACAGHRRGEVQGSLDGAQDVVGDGAQKRLELGLVEEPDLGRFGWLGLLGELGRVGTAPAAVLAECEDRVHRADVVEDALGRLALTALGGHERLDVLRGDAVDVGVRAK